MSHKNYSEYEQEDQEVEDSLNDIYGEVEVCGMVFDSGRILKELDRIAFDQYISDSMQWYQCGVCDKIYRDDDAEEEAKECCQQYCDDCGKELDDSNESGFCEDCQELEDEEDEDDNTEDSES